MKKLQKKTMTLVCCEDAADAAALFSIARNLIVRFGGKLITFAFSDTMQFQQCFPLEWCLVVLLKDILLAGELGRPNILKMVDSSQKSVAKCTTGKCRFSMFQFVCCKFYSWMMHWVGPTEILRKGKYSFDFWTCKVLVHYKVLEYLILEVVEFLCAFGELELQQLFEISLKVYDVDTG